jgi:demethylmenaquinone methyltransferase/2-methoxy-6-polyprenyl-1,4-benzoquinol methylase
MVRDLFDGIDKRYDFLNHLLSFCVDYHWREVMARELLPLGGAMVLDLAAGTGDSAATLLRKGVTVVGVDVSLNMLARGRAKINRSDYHPVLASGYSLPFKEGSFDGATCAFGIRNMPETALALRELCRVLKKGGKVVFLEFSMPRGFFRTLYRFYLRKVIPTVAGLFSDRAAYEYLGTSIEAFHGPEEFCRLIEQAGFESCEKYPLSLGVVHIHRASKP